MMKLGRPLLRRVWRKVWRFLLRWRPLRRRCLSLSRLSPWLVEKVPLVAPRLWLWGMVVARLPLVFPGPWLVKGGREARSEGSATTIPTPSHLSPALRGNRCLRRSAHARYRLWCWPRRLSLRWRPYLGATGGVLALVGRQRMGRLMRSLRRIPRAMSMGVGGSWKGGTEGLGRAVVVRLEICFLCCPFACIWAALGWRVLCGGW